MPKETRQQAQELIAILESDTSAITASSEIDSKAKLALIISIALIAFSLASDKPNSIQFLGLTFSNQSEVIFSLVLLFAVIYAGVMLVLAWKVDSNSKKLKRVIELSKLMSITKNFTAEKLNKIDDESKKYNEIIDWKLDEINKVGEKEGELFSGLLNLSIRQNEYEQEVKKLQEQKFIIENEFDSMLENAGIIHMHPKNFDNEELNYENSSHHKLIQFTVDQLESNNRDYKRNKLLTFIFPMVLVGLSILLSILDLANLKL